MHFDGVYRCACIGIGQDPLILGWLDLDADGTSVGHFWHVSAIHIVGSSI